MFRELFYPAIVAVLASIVSYWASKRLQEATQKKDRENKRTDLIDRLLLGFDKLDNSLNRLQNDVENFGIFFLRNIDISLSILGDLSNLCSDIILIKDGDLRRQTLSLVDNTKALTEEMKIMENWLVTRENEEKEKGFSFFKELNNFKFKLLKLNYHLDQNNNIVKINSNKLKNNTDKDQANINVLKEIYLSLGVNLDNKSLEKLRQDDKEKRQMYTIKLVDSQTKITLLKQSLQKVL